MQVQKSKGSIRRDSFNPVIEIIVESARSYTISLTAFKVITFVAHGGGNGDAFHPKIYGVTLFLQNTPPSTIFICG